MDYPTLSLKSILSTFVDKEQYQLAQSLITIINSPYSLAIDDILGTLNPKDKLYSLLLPNVSKINQTYDKDTIKDEWAKVNESLGTMYVNQTTEDIKEQVALDFPNQVLTTDESSTTDLTKLSVGYCGQILSKDLTWINPEQIEKVEPLKKVEVKLNQPAPDNVYHLKDFKDFKVDESLVKIMYRKLKAEDKLILLTFAWANRSCSSSFVIKHSQRLAAYFNLHQDERWGEFYENGRSKMQSLITNRIVQFKKRGLIQEYEIEGKNSEYGLTNIGFSLGRIIANEVNFNLVDSATTQVSQ